MKEIVIFGAQKASINNFYYALKKLKSLKKKVTLYNNDLFGDFFLNKLKKKISNIKCINKINLKNKIIITGTSETFFEKNLWIYFRKNGLKCYAYVDSWVNIKQRFKSTNCFPDFILVQDQRIKKEINKKFQQIQSSDIIVIGNPFHYYLSKNRRYFISKKNNFMFLTSNKGIKKELPIIKQIFNQFIKNKQSFYICLHPRENYKEWQRNIKIKNIYLTQDEFINKIKFVDYVFGIDTMGLIDSFYLSKKVFYLKSKNFNNKLMFKIFSNLGMSNFKFNGKKIILEKKVSKNITPFFQDFTKSLN